MPPKNPWKHQTIKLINAGLDVLHPIDQVDENHFTRMEDCKSLQEGDITPRPGTALVNAQALGAQTPVITQRLIKEHADGTNKTSYTSGGGFPNFLVDKLYLITIAGKTTGGGTVTVDTVTGGGITWVKIVDEQFSSIASPDSCLTVWRGMESSGLSGSNINYVYSATVGGGMMSCTEFDNVVITGTSGADAIQQVVTALNDSTATPSVTLAGFTSGQNGTFGAFAQQNESGTIAPGTGFAEISDLAAAGSTHLETQWRNDNDTIVDCTPSLTDANCIAGIELIAS